MAHPGLRFAAGVCAGNVLGYLGFRLARAVIPWLWAARPPDSNLLLLVGLVAATFTLLAAPPVLAGALGASLARRAQALAGLASGLWALSLLRWLPAVLPADVPLAGGLWYAPTVLVLLSGMLGGWLLELSGRQWLAESE